MWVECKVINRGKYLYLRFRQGVTQRSLYIGKAGPAWDEGQVVALPDGLAPPEVVRERLRRWHRLRPDEVVTAAAQAALL